EHYDAGAGKHFFFHAASNKTQWDRPAPAFPAAPKAPSAFATPVSAFGARPAPLAPAVPKALAPATALAPAVAKAVAPAAPLAPAGMAPGWEEHYDAAAGKHFYFHAATNKTQWDKPAAAPAAPAAPKAPSALGTFATPALARPAPLAPAAPAVAKAVAPAAPPAPAGLAAGWEEHYDAGAGKSFYFHAATNKTQWDKPAAPAAPAAPLAQSALARSALLAPAPKAPAAPVSSALLPGWEEHHDAGAGKSFYFHAATNKTQWDKPAAHAAPAAPTAVATPALARPGMAPVAPMGLAKPALAAAPAAAAAPAGGLAAGWQ
ncbi:unnamed protein product, partial [Polarella glacialis]